MCKNVWLTPPLGVPHTVLQMGYAVKKEVCAVMDGADWCHLFAQTHQPDAVRVLDFPGAEMRAKEDPEGGVLPLLRPFHPLSYCGTHLGPGSGPSCRKTPNVLDLDCL